MVDLILELLRLCMEELDVISQPLLDTVLIHLLPVTKTENPKSYQLAKVGLGRGAGGRLPRLDRLAGA